MSSSFLTLCRMGRAHAGGVQGRDLVDALLHLVTQVLVDVLDGVVFHVLAPVAGEAVDAVLVAESLQRLDEQDRALLLQVDDALVRAPGRAVARAPVAQPQHVVDGVVGRVPLVRPAPRLVDGLARRRAHVEQEEHRHVALQLVAAPVDTVRQAQPLPHVDHGFHKRVEVVLLAVLQALHLAEGLRPHLLELAAELLDHVGVGVQNGLPEADVPLRHRLLPDHAPPRAIVAGAEVPLVVDARVRVLGLQRPALVLDVNERALPLRGLLWRQLHPDLAHEVLCGCAGVQVVVAALLQLGALREQLLQHLAGELRRLALVGLPLGLLHLLEQLH